jgi:signal transduction histidine kinase
MLIVWLQRHPRLIDWALLLAALATAVGAAAHHSRPAIGVPLAVLGSLPLLARRRHPLPVLAIATAAMIAQVAGLDLYAPMPTGIALFTVADQLERRESLLAGVATVAALALPLWASVGWTRPLDLLGHLIGFVVAWLIGDSIGTRRRYIAALEERAERLEREREAEAARAVAEEQARIARELHDVIAHTLSVIVVQAAAARDVFASRPERAREALQAIERSGRGALQELRGLLSSVRGEHASFAPPSRLSDLDRLIEELGQSGLSVSLTIEGRPTELPQAVELSAYRVVQEALTNTLKHARATKAEVALRWGADALRVEIHDDGLGSAGESGTGHGIVGMQERLALLGGTLTAGPAGESERGFSVVARFPLASQR